QQLYPAFLDDLFPLATLPSRAQHVDARAARGLAAGAPKNWNVEERMTTQLSRRSLLALGAGFSASTMLGGTALAKAPKLGTQPPYWHRIKLGEAEITVVSDGTLPLGPPKGPFVGV